MQKFISILFLVLCSYNIKAQEHPNNSSTPITISYWGHHIFHPGMKIGTQYNFKNWDEIKKRKKGALIKHKTLFLKPELGIYHHKKNHTGTIFNADIGVEISKNEQKFFKAYSFGLGYIRQFNSGITYVLEKDNSISKKKWASRGYIMPSLNIEYGQHFRYFSWFNTFSLASKMKYNTGFSVELFFEMGIKIYPF